MYVYNYNNFAKTSTILILLKKKNVMALSIGIKNSKIASMILLISIKSCQNTQFQRILF